MGNLRKRKNKQFCVQKFSEYIEFHGMTRQEGKLGVLLRGLVSEETVVLRRWGSETRKFGLSTELIM